MGRIDLSRAVFLTLSGLLGFGLVFGLGFYLAVSQGNVYVILTGIGRMVTTSFQQVLGEASTIVGIRPDHFLQPARGPGEGVTVNDPAAGADDLILLAGFFQGGNQVRLIKRDGTIVARWPVVFSELVTDQSKLLTPPETNWNTDLHGTMALPDGSVLFNFEFNGTVKLDRCGKVDWVLADMTHHSIESAAGGGYWIPGRFMQWPEDKVPDPPLAPPYFVDTLAKVSADGKIEREIPITEIFHKNGLDHLFTLTGIASTLHPLGDRKISHLNKITELSPEKAAEFPMLEAGDLALSLRTLNMIMIVDPDDLKVKFWRMGPWLRQHDPEFDRDGKLLIFNNNMIHSRFGGGRDFDQPNVPLVSDIMEWDLKTDQVRVVYGQKPGQEMGTMVRGKVDITHRDTLMITDFEAGRAVEVDRNGKKLWEYINRFDADTVAEMTEAKLYPADYFQVSDWSCPK